MGNEARDQKNITKRKLNEFSGKEGKPAYVAFKGKIYDVSDSPLWMAGAHLGRHFAGEDLSSSMSNAPHGEEVLTRFRVVGRLSEESVRIRFSQRIVRMKFHPIVIHFATAYPVVVALLSILCLFSGQICFERAAYYLLALGFLAAPFAGVTGLISWRIAYEGRMTRIFFRKITLTIIQVAVISACFVWRTLNPNVLMTITDASYIYFSLVMFLVPVTILLGYYGGRIVFS